MIFVSLINIISIINKETLIQTKNLKSSSKHWILTKKDQNMSREKITRIINHIIINKKRQICLKKI